MAVWDQVAGEVTRPHVAYAVTGFALVMFGTISLFLKEKLYIGEATVATIYGLIVGPHCLNWFAPTTWGNTDYITLEISRIVLIVQIFAVAVELPKKYMMKHWWSVGMLLLPVMAYGWLIASVFIWKLVPSLRWIEALCIAGCVTATDPVLAAAVVGKGKFSRRVPGHLRNLLSAESGCNDGMAYPFVIMAVYIMKSETHPREIAKNFICIGVLYSCCLGIAIGVVIGYGTRHLIKFAERKNLVDRESFLMYYFCVAVFCAGVGTLCGVDDLLVAFAAGAAFSWDGWFSKKTEETHVSEVIDVLLNTGFFVYFGAVVPWPDFNNFDIGIKAWKLVCLAIIVLVVRRIPIMLMIKPITPDIHTWREALFCGHFGPIGVGAIYMSLLARAQFETHSEVPTDGPSHSNEHYILLATIWPITCFLVIASIIIHGSSVAVFTLGKRINNMAVTLTYTTNGNEPSWMSRLPRRSMDGNILQLRRMETEEPMAKKIKRKGPKFPKRKSKTDAVQPNFVFPPKEDVAVDNNQQENQNNANGVIPVLTHEEIPNKTHDQNGSGRVIGLNLRVDMEDGVFDETANIDYDILAGKDISEINNYAEGRYVVIEDKEGTFIHQFDLGEEHPKVKGQPHLKVILPEEVEQEIKQNAGTSSTIPVEFSASSGDSDKSNSWSLGEKEKNGKTESSENTLVVPPRASLSQQRPRRRSRPIRHRRVSTVGLPNSQEHAFVYIIDDTVVVENAEGEILRRYQYVQRGQTPRDKSWKDYLSKVPVINKLVSHDESFKDLEHSPDDILIPTDNPPLSAAASKAISVEDEEHVRRRLSQMLRVGTITRRSSSVITDSNRRPLSLSSRANTYRSQAIASDDDDEYTDYDDDVEPETDIERHRRLAALGVISTEDRDDDDRDEFADQRVASNTTTTTTTQHEDEPKITFQLPTRPTT